MGLLIECPVCRKRIGIKKGICTCGKNVRKDSGKCYWIEYYLDGSRVRERIGFSKLAAENRFREVQTAKAEKRNIRRNLNAVVTLQSIASWYLQLDEVLELSSFERVRVLVSHVVRLLGARTKIDSLTPEKIRDYRKKRKKEFLASRPGRNPSDTTINREVSAFKTMLNRGVANGIIDSNPIRFVPLLKENNVRERILNSDEFERLYDSADEHLKPVIMMAYFHPMRREEILKLTWDEVDLSGSVGMIRLSSERTKGKKQGRAIPLHPKMREILEQLRKKNCGERVFLRYGKPFNECKNSFEKAKSKAQIKDFRFHDFRHCAISNLRKAGNDYTTIMKASGHRTFSMFLRYNLVSHEELKKMKFSSGKNEKTQPMKQRLLSLGLDPEEVLSSLLHEKVS